MKIQPKRYSKTRGFTLVELLTTIAIIGVLIGLLVPALGLIRDTALMVKQKSQLHNIGLGLESFQTDFGDYPPSDNIQSLTEKGYCGAQKLAEAIVGWDGYGVHPKTEFRSNGSIDYNKDGLDELLYDVVGGVTNNNVGGPPYLESPEDNVRVRKGPYLEIEGANAVRLSGIYGSIALDIANPNYKDQFVLADMFGKVTNATTKKRTGMPILYYKAYANGKMHSGDNTIIWTSPRLNTYDVRDNGTFLDAEVPFAPGLFHPLQGADTAIAIGELFYGKTANPNFPGPPRRPYRSESYILHSAGPDGLYGSADDVFNFDSEQKGM